MNISSISDYLSGKAFSNSLILQITETKQYAPYRMQAIERIVSGKNIIHFGCADHIEIIEEKIRKNTWFHKRLMSCTNRCIGIDNNEKAIDYLVSQLKIPDVFYLDIERDDIPENISQQKFDYLVMGEIIEHVDNPVSFLKSIHEKFGSCVENIILTTPNAFRWSNFRHAFNNFEGINSDHRYWFTPYTISKVLYLAGFKDIDCQLVQSFRNGKTEPLRQIMYKRFPLFQDTILILAKL